MAKKRVPLHQNPRGFVDVDPDATNGAQVGVNLLGPDGQILTAAQVINPTTSGSGGPGSIASTIWKLIKEIPLNIQKLAALIGAGFAVRKNDGEWALRTLQEGTGIDIANPNGDAGNPTIGLEDAPNSGAGTLQAITVDSKGRVVGRKAATITGTSGRVTVTNGDASAGLPTIDLATVADSGTGALLALTKDAYGRVTGSRPATITGTAQQIDVANGTAAAGLPTISLADLPNSGVGAALVRITRDAKGRVSGTQAATTDNLPEGTTNLYFTTARAAAASPVQSVNGKTGVVVLGPSDIGAATAAQGAKADSALQSVVAGTGITVNNADPRNPIITATGGGGAVTSVNSRTGAVSVPDFASKATAPTSSDFGRPIIDGDRWFNTTNGVDYTWVAGAWTYDNAAALSRYMPAYLSDGTASAVPLNADGTVPAYLSNGSYSPFATQA